MGGRESQEDRLNDILIFNIDERTIADISDEDFPLDFEAASAAALKLTGERFVCPSIDEGGEAALLRYDHKYSQLRVITRANTWDY